MTFADLTRSERIARQDIAYLLAQNVLSSAALNELKNTGLLGSNSADLVGSVISLEQASALEDATSLLRQANAAWRHNFDGAWHALVNIQCLRRSAILYALKSNIPSVLVERLKKSEFSSEALFDVEILNELCADLEKQAAHKDLLRAASSSAFKVKNFSSRSFSSRRSASRARTFSANSRNTSLRQAYQTSVGRGQSGSRRARGVFRPSRRGKQA